MNNKLKGDKFRDEICKYYAAKKVFLTVEYKVNIGLNTKSTKKEHKYDLGNQKYLIECKSYDYTSEGNIPSAKLSTINESMLYFLAA